MGVNSKLSIFRFLVFSIWRFPTMRQTKNTFGLERDTELVRLGPSSNTVFKNIKKVPPTASRNVLLLIGIRDFVAHFGKLVEKGVYNFSIRNES